MRRRSNAARRALGRYHGLNVKCLHLSVKHVATAFFRQFTLELLFSPLMHICVFIFSLFFFIFPKCILLIYMQMCIILSELSVCRGDLNSNRKQQEL